ncbi:MAG: hypothetical protein H0S85_16210 [Desulfovibrionaceae bacterium]|jgi:hypothetical protein|nr:hypothetical protein [Desulfovibrionaceae bacterium]
MPYTINGPAGIGIDVDPFSKLDMATSRAWKAAEKKLTAAAPQPAAQAAESKGEIANSAEARESLAAAVNMVSRDAVGSHTLDPARVAELLGL